MQQQILEPAQAGFIWSSLKDAAAVWVNLVKVIVLIVRELSKAQNIKAPTSERNLVIYT